MILLPEDGKTRVQLNSNFSYMVQESWRWQGVGGGGWLKGPPCILLTLKVLESPSLDIPYPKSAPCRHPQTVLRASIRLRTCNLVRNRAPGA